MYGKSTIFGVTSESNSRKTTCNMKLIENWAISPKVYSEIGFIGFNY